MSHSSFLILLDKNPHIQFVDFLLTDLNGIFRGKRYPIRYVESVIKKGLRLPFSTVGVDVWGQDVMSNGLIFETGDADGFCWPVAPVRIPFFHPDEEVQSSSNIAEVLVMMTQADGQTPFLADPRQLLAHILQWYKDKKLQAVVATELEFYLFDDNAIVDMKNSVSSDVPIHSSQMYSISELDKFTPFLDRLYSVCERQQIPIETAISESGIGQFELNLQHSNNVLQVADQTIAFKHIVKQVAQEFAMTASFMAKPKKLDSGSGMHVHASVCNKQGESIFDHNQISGEENLKHAIGGCLSLLSDSMLMLAPHHNSYRRFNAQTHAPTTISWGYDNRTSAIRVPETQGIGARLEHRVAGADANPYLVLTAVLTGIAYGLESKADPGEATDGNAYDENDQANNNTFPDEWGLAINAFVKSQALEKYLGKTFIKVYSECKKQEHNVLNQYISPFELDTYLDKV